MQILVRKADEQDRSSQGFVHLQMGTNRFANQSGMTGFGMPRHNITKYTDGIRGEMPNDDSTMSRQTTGWKEGKHHCVQQFSKKSLLIFLRCTRI